MSTDEADEDNVNLKLMNACKKGDLEFVEHLLLKESNYNVNTQDENGSTCLHDTAVHNCQFISISKLLLEYGASVNIKDNEGNTPLHNAVLFHCIENVKLMMSYKPDLSLVNEDNASAIDFAANTEDNEILKLLVGEKFVESKKPKKVKSKRKNKKGNNIKNIKNVKSYLPIPAINSPSILKKRKLTETDKIVNQSSLGYDNICKRVKFDLDVAF